LLSIRFSEIESLITHIIEKLINSDNDKVGYLLIEHNTLDRNLEVLKQINKQRAYEEEKISQTISELKSLKEIRNSFIHGVWSDVTINDKNETYIYCANHKWVKVKQIPSYMKDFNGTLSRRYGSKKYTLKDLDSIIKKSEEILYRLKTVWESLQEVNYFD